MEQPLISVIICFLNPGKWLEEAVESVINQTYTNWELILMDDGSNEEDSRAALKYANLYPSKIRYAQHEDHINMGLSASRNKGIALSEGKFVAFLDADDFWYKNKLCIQLAIFDKFPTAAMVCEASQFWYSWNDKECFDPITWIGAQEGLYEPGQLNKLLYPLGEGQPPCPTGIIIRKEALIRNGGFEEQFNGIFQLYEDQAFLAKIYLKESVYISAECNNKYRKHDGSMSGAAADLWIYSKVRNFFLDWFIQYIGKENLPLSGLEDFITRARLPLTSVEPE